MTTVKGLLKGLRYISQIFEEKEEEIQIGYPTDVKHVAHIGSDGPSTTTPSWMNKFKGEGEAKDKHASAQDGNTETKNSLDEDPLDLSPTRRSSGKSKHSRRHHSSSGSMGSPARDSTKPRKHKNSGDLDQPAPMGSPARDPSKPRRHKNSGDLDGSNKAKKQQNLNPGSESPRRNLPEIPKARRKKSKEGGGSGRSSRSKGSDTLPESYAFSEAGPDMS